MKPASSTIKAASGWGVGIALMLSAVSVFFPEYYARIPPGTEGYLVIGAGMIGGYFKKETVLK